MSSSTPWRAAIAGAALTTLIACAGEAPTEPTTHLLAPDQATLARADQAEAGKVDICHVRGNGDYHLINVSGNAQPAHLGHGDALPASDHPELDGHFLADTCETVEASDVTCTETYADLDACSPYGEGDSDGNESGHTTGPGEDGDDNEDGENDDTVGLP